MQLDHESSQRPTQAKRNVYLYKLVAYYIIKQWARFSLSNAVLWFLLRIKKQKIVHFLKPTLSFSQFVMDVTCHHLMPAFEIKSEPYVPETGEQTSSVRL